VFISILITFRRVKAAHISQPLDLVSGISPKGSVVPRKTLIMFLNFNEAATTSQYIYFAYTHIHTHIKYIL